MIPHCSYHPLCPPRQSSFSSLSFLCGLAPNPEETHGVVLLRSVCALPPYHLLCFLNLAWTFSSRPSRFKVPPEFWIAFLLLPSSCCNTVGASTYLRHVKWSVQLSPTCFSLETSSCPTLSLLQYEGTRGPHSSLVRRPTHTAQRSVVHPTQPSVERTPSTKSRYRGPLSLVCTLDRGTCTWYSAGYKSRFNCG